MEDEITKYKLKKKLYNELYDGLIRRQGLDRNSFIDRICNLIENYAKCYQMRSPSYFINEIKRFNADLSFLDAKVEAFVDIIYYKELIDKICSYY